MTSIAVPSLHKARNVFLDMQENLHTFTNGLITPGQYQFPFTIYLPDWLPSSFLYFGKLNCVLKVEYKIKVNIKGTNVPLFAEKKLVIRQHMYAIHQKAKYAYT
jgi:hypothetical protein